MTHFPIAGVGNILGTLMPGKLADLVMVAGNPLERIDDTVAVRMVMKGGALHSIDSLVAFPESKRP